MINGTCVSASMAEAQNVTVFFSKAYNDSQLDYYVEPVTEYWE